MKTKSIEKLADKLIMLNPEEQQELQLILRAKLMPEMAKKQQEQRTRRLRLLCLKILKIQTLELQLK